MRLARNVAYALGAALFALLAMSIVNAQVWPLVIDIGGRDARFAYGFHDPEIDVNLETRFRWSDGDSTIALPQPPALTPSLLILRLPNGRPTNAPLPRVTLTTDGRELASFTPPDYYPRIYRLIIPPNERLDWAVRIGIISDTISTPTDARALGIVVDTVILAPLRMPVILPSLWVTLCALSIGGLGYTLLRLIGLALRSAFVISLSLSALIALVTLLYPLETLPFLQRFAFLLAVGNIGGLLLRLFIPLIHEHDPSFPRLAGAYVPIAMAIMWWMSPLAQWLIGSDGMPPIFPPRPVIWIGTVTGTMLLIVYVATRTLPRNRRQVAVFILLSLGACAHLMYSISFAYTRQAPDFWILFRGAREWTRGGSMYDIEAVLTNHFGHVFKVPPFYGMLFVPFVTMDGLMVLLGHRIMNTLLIIATALLWLRMWRIPFVSLGAAGLLIVFNFRPLADTLAYGQIDLVLLFLLTLALWALRSGRDIAAGALVALGTLFKIYPILLVVFFVAKRHWRALAGFVIGMVVCNGIAIAVIGWDEHLTYLTQVLPNIGGTTSWVENQTISGFLARLTDSPHNATIYQNEMVRLLGTALSGGVALVTCVLALRPTSRDSTGYALQYSMFLLLMVLASPTAWMHYETLLILPFGALILHLRERSVSLPYATLLALSFALIAYGNQWSFYDGTIHGILTIAGVSYKFYGMLMLGGVLAYEALREPAPTHLPYPARLIARSGNQGMSADL
ncbi:MAG: glycosyltransferase family 87 protein [Chloroflexus sp.]|uniref:glycosyltransferase family 87 protein n=1 Tax=Chloroflexus sp. TaxID=1904827 RepID=UPI00404B25D0